MTRRIFVVVPSMTPSGPVKGAIALANGLVERGVDVTLVSVKDDCAAAWLGLDRRAKSLGLGSYAGWQAKDAAYREVLVTAGGRPEVTSISMCFSADRLNAAMRRQAHILASVRGNLFMNYRYDYGRRGVFFALAHLLMLQRFDGVVAMSESMARQMGRFGLRGVRVIPNFIDELALSDGGASEGRSGSGGDMLRLAFVGSLSERKRPDLLIDLAARYPVDIQLIGDGPLRAELERRASAQDMKGRVTFHGQVRDPLPIVGGCSYMVLPSQSEGISRAVMEALYIGVPCILRRVDANEQVVRDGQNGFVFANDADLLRLVGNLVDGSHRISVGRCLLPDLFRQRVNVDAYLQFANQEVSL
jgi:glycosyltransferase involved in cell wall biosynthesis